MNIEDIKQKLANFNDEWKSGIVWEMEDFHEEVRFLLQELEKVQRENERLIVSLQKLANATNDPSRVKWPEV